MKGHSCLFFLAFKERQKFEIERELLQQRATKEISDLQGSIQRLKTVCIYYCYIKINSHFSFDSIEN